MKEHTCIFKNNTSKIKENKMTSTCFGRVSEVFFGMAPVAECSPSKQKTFSSNLSNTKKSFL
jgi:hypothetical protein